MDDSPIEITCISFDYLINPFIDLPRITIVPYGSGNADVLLVGKYHGPQLDAVNHLGPAVGRG